MSSASDLSIWPLCLTSVSDLCIWPRYIYLCISSMYLISIWHASDLSIWPLYLTSISDLCIWPLYLTCSLLLLYRLATVFSPKLRCRLLQARGSRYGADPAIDDVTRQCGYGDWWALQGVLQIPFRNKSAEVTIVDHGWPSQPCPK